MSAASTVRRGPGGTTVLTASTSTGASPSLSCTWPTAPTARVQVYDMEGGFKRAFGADFLTTPSGFVTYGDLMVIAELRARLAITDIDDNLVTYLGDNQQVCDVEGWPNNMGDGGNIVPTGLLETGKFNSPHGLAVDADGNLYVAEWLIGGRVTKLDRS